MQEPDPTHDHPTTEPSGTSPSRLRRRLALVLSLLLVILALAFIPPLINVSRFQRRVARNISASIGRPVHFDQLSLKLLPLPGFTLERFVVDEDPAFGYEPILRADEVRITLRISSLWRRRVEFSKIALTEPTSVNLVRAANGKWNIESLLVQASRIEAAPTAQRFAGPAPRFPYIEATGARINLKLDQVKTPLSLTEADFSLWLPEPHQWHFRLEAHPIRSDTSPGETGILRIGGTLGETDARAASLAQIPIDLSGDWREGQLGGLSRLIMGRDAGLRGDFSLTFGVLGSIGYNTIATDIKLGKARRADFVPASPLSLETTCHAIAQNTFHTFSSIECHWPPVESSDRSFLILTADLPDIRQPHSASASIILPALPGDTFLDWLSVATPHPPTGLTGPGTLAGAVTWGPSNSGPPTATRARNQRRPISPPQAPPQPHWSGELEFSGESLQVSALGPDPIPLGDVLLRSTPPTVAPSSHSRIRTPATPAPQSVGETGFDLLPISLPLGGKQPASLEGHFDASGYTLHLSGSAIPARVLALGDAIPQLGDGLAQLLDPASTAPPTLSPEAPANPLGRGRATSRRAPSSAELAEDPSPVHIDLTATRAWGSPQIWRQTTQPPTHTRHRTSH